MATGHLQAVLRHIRKLAGTRAAAEVTDGQLLERFVTQRDEIAFELLVRRHERMVWGVCRRLLANSHDAEDAFQAAFVVLVRKAGTVRKRESISCWLYQVAYRIALQRLLANAPTAEARQRAEALLARLQGPITDPEIIRSLRAVEVLEHIATRDAKQLLQEVARGAPESRLTQEAKRSLGRLAKRAIASP
jgi:RNA polymerase sigma factor (sigma-70 family)